MPANRAAHRRAATVLQWSGTRSPVAGGLLAALAHAALLWALIGLKAAAPPITQPPRAVTLTLLPPTPAVAQDMRVTRPQPALQVPAVPTPRVNLPPVPPVELSMPARPALPASESTPEGVAAAAPPSIDPPPLVAAPPQAPPPPLRTVNADALGFAVAPVLHYPALSRRLGEEGRVLLRARIDASGAPVELSIAASSGHPRLDQAALDAARRARLRPLIDAGEARAAWVLLPFVFRLEAA
jgi:protein TonB